MIVFYNIYGQISIMDTKSAYNRHVEMQVYNSGNIFLDGEKFHGVQDFVTKRPTVAFMWHDSII